MGWEEMMLEGIDLKKRVNLVWDYTWRIALIALITLIIANFVASNIKREVFDENTAWGIIPHSLHGKWEGALFDNEPTLIIGEDTIEVINDSADDQSPIPNGVYKIEKVILYYEGRFFSYLFGDPKFGIIFDKNATRKIVPKGVPLEDGDRFYLDWSVLDGAQNRTEVEFSNYMWFPPAGPEDTSDEPGHRVESLGYLIKTK